MSSTKLGFTVSSHSQRCDHHYDWYLINLNKNKTEVPEHCLQLIKKPLEMKTTVEFKICKICMQVSFGTNHLHISWKKSHQLQNFVLWCVLCKHWIEQANQLQQKCRLMWKLSLLNLRFQVMQTIIVSCKQTSHGS